MERQTYFVRIESHLFLHLNLVVIFSSLIADVFHTKNMEMKKSKFLSIAINQPYFLQLLLYRDWNQNVLRHCIECSLKGFLLINYCFPSFEKSVAIILLHVHCACLTFHRKHSFDHFFLVIPILIYFLRIYYVSNILFNYNGSSYSECSACSMSLRVYFLSQVFLIFCFCYCSIESF